MKKIVIILTLLTAFGCSSPETETVELERPPPVSESELNQIFGVNDSELTPDGTPGIEQTENDTVPEQQSGPDTSNDTFADTSPEQESDSNTSSDTNPDTSLEQESGPDASNNTNNSFSRRVSSKEYRDSDDEVRWQHFYFYDDAGKLLTEEVRFDSEFLTDDIITYQYNVDGLLTAKSTEQIGLGTVDRLLTFEYDEQGRVVSMAEDRTGAGNIVDFNYYSYSNEGRLAGYDTYGYYNAGALSSTGTYIYDENNVRTGIIFEFFDAGSANLFGDDSTLTHNYTYNEAGELESKEFGGASEHYLFEDGPCSSAHLILDDDVLCR